MSEAWRNLFRPPVPKPPKPGPQESWWLDQPPHGFTALAKTKIHQPMPFLIDAKKPPAHDA